MTTTTKVQAPNKGLKELSKIAREAWIKANPGKEPRPLKTKKERK